ncbi:patched domain-containing protein 3-like [Mercenaria mercenaria]|uniref:patched domain-containing protein 3-like n=1 Tax=Mercenaria mercenaria TaxID=6596 RepID=UPI00234EF9A8|nr:patched domain-containing protein 3-like [Mercenaria mercenaria]XP_045205430.2 patched domain-containing protein 3-like [Mercenaria mercenaria]
MKCAKFYECVEEKIGGVFSSYGRFVSRHAWKIIIITVIVNAGLGVGMLKLKSDIDTGNVYYPTGSQARKDKAKVEGIFPDLSGSNYNSLQLTEEAQWARVIVRSKSGNLLKRLELEEVQDIAEHILNITATDENGAAIEFSDFCAITHTQCAVEGDLFWDTDFLLAVDNDNVTYPEFTTTKAGTQSYVSDIGGKQTFDATGQYLTGVEFIKISFTIRTDGSIFEDKATKWVDKFNEYMDTYTSNRLDLAYGHFKSLDEELDKNVSGDITLFSITFTLMITYACFTTLSSRCTDQVGQRMMLGFAGIFAAGLAILTGFGFCAAIGVEFVSIVGVLPFLLIGIGIDDMFILLSGLSEAQTKTTVEDKMAETLRISGVGITITSLTDLIAFMAGAGSSFVAVKNFCIYTGVTVIFCYINNVTFFASCLAINERRVEGNRHFLTCRRIKTKEQLSNDGASTNVVMCCGGTPPTNRNEAEGYLDRLPRWLVPKIVLKTPFKVIIIFLFIGYLAAAIYGCIHMKQGLLLTNLVNEDSYFYKYSKWDEEQFPRQTPVSFVIHGSYEYSKSQTKNMIDNLISETHSNKYFDNVFKVNWLESYGNSVHYDNVSETAFITGVYKFITDPRYSRFENDVVIDSTNQSITASRVYVLSAKLDDSQDEGKMMLEARAIADAATINCFAFSPYFVAFEQYVAILGQSLQSVGIALAAVFVITCIFMPHPVLILFVTIAVTMIMVGVFGFMFYIDVTLSAITMIHLILSVGFSIDFTAHICHGYMISRSKTREERVSSSIDKTGAPIFHGAISSLLGILVLFWAKSYIFRTFGIVMSFVLLFGITHALLLLPVVLSWIGPLRHNSVEKKQSMTDIKQK